MDERNKGAIKGILARLREDGIDYQAYDDLLLMCHVGFLEDVACKYEYKHYSDYVKKIALQEVVDDSRHASMWRNLYWQAVKDESYHFFESFLYYMERKRPYEKRFYEPRQKTLKVVVDDLQRLEDSKTQKMYGLSQPSRTGKLLSDDTPVLTKNGWTFHGCLKAGDYVVGRNGEWVKVLQVHPKNVANMRVHFSDHTYVDCHENHEWVVIDRFRPGKERVMETKDLVNCHYHENENILRRRYALPQTCVVKGRRVDLKVDPYVLGVWLGDGTNTKPYLTIDNKDTVIVDEVKKHYEHSKTYEQIGCKVYTFHGLRMDLQEYGMCHSRRTVPKRIPADYLLAPVEQKLELLAGLIDTDGTLVRKERRYHISTIEPKLAKDIYALIGSFGWRVSMHKEKPIMSSSGIQGKNAVYDIGFNPEFEIPCRVDRKKLDVFSRQKKIYIDRIEPIDPKPGNCITVEGGVYRVGETMKLTHNSTLIIFFIAWVILRNPYSHNAIGTHSGILASHFYKELLDLFTTEEYTYQELYQYFNPALKFIEDKSAENLTLSFVTRGDFPTITCRGIDGTWTGAVDISSDGYLCVDDLVRDRQHSLSPKRMNDTFSEYLNKMVDRKNDGAKELMIGTLWNVLDPLMRLEEMYKGNPDYVFRKIPALNENNESNFDYEFKGFSTQYFLDMKDRLIRAGNEAEWCAKFMQAPYIREGILFAYDELRFFNGILPQGHEYSYIVVCDVAFGGGDSVSMPIGLQDQETGEVYIVDWFFSSLGVAVTVPGVVDKLIKYGIMEVTFEKNNGGQMYAEKVQEELKKRNYLCSCNTKPAPNNIAKEDKIKGCEPEIKSKIIFLDGTKYNPDELGDIVAYSRGAQYERALDELTTFVTIGKNEHDDAADSIAQLAIKAFGRYGSGKVELVDRVLLGF